mmetsp:Transcript_111645/g.355195  ORF Transcript_111645/g.355195 Transcript_111645/m.355195 type:complete len:224 (-) Transcript_111645:1194-1865(-)
MNYASSPHVRASKRVLQGPGPGPPLQGAAWHPQPCGSPQQGGSCAHSVNAADKCTNTFGKAKTNTQFNGAERYCSKPSSCNGILCDLHHPVRYDPRQIQARRALLALGSSSASTRPKSASCAKSRSTSTSLTKGSVCTSSQSFSTSPASMTSSCSARALRANAVMALSTSSLAFASWRSVSMRPSLPAPSLRFLFAHMSFNSFAVLASSSSFILASTSSIFAS